MAGKIWQYNLHSVNKEVQILNSLFTHTPILSEFHSIKLLYSYISLCALVFWTCFKFCCWLNPILDPSNFSKVHREYTYGTCMW